MAPSVTVLPWRLSVLKPLKAPNRFMRVSVTQMQERSTPTTGRAGSLSSRSTLPCNSKTVAMALTSASFAWREGAR